MRRPALWCLAAGALLGAGACQQTPPGPCEAPATYNAQTAENPGVAPAWPQPMAAIGRRGARLLDATTSLAVVQEVRAGRRPNGAVEVAVRIMNCTASPLQLEAATQFFDGAGSVAEPVTAWKRVFVPPRSARDYGEISAGRDAVSFMVDLRGGT